MRWFLRFYFLLAFAVIPLTLHAAPLPPSPPGPVTPLSPVSPPPPGPVTPVSPVSPPPPGPVKASEFDPGTISSGMALLIGAGWLAARRLRRNRRSN
jgi:uncharacterized protein (TIGR03382 family)